VNRAYPVADVKVYSNAASVELNVNGAPVGAKTSDLCAQRTCVFEDVALVPGVNTLVATGNHAGTPVTDTVEWTLATEDVNIAAGRLATGLVTTAGTLFGSDDFFVGGDTAFVPNRTAAPSDLPVLSQDGVGGDPAVFGMTRRAFHAATTKRARSWPHTMLATSTHDNQRSEDVRARIAVISELPAAWRLSVRRWTRMNRSRRKTPAEGVAPSPSDEYLLYQTLVGSFPAESSAGALDDYRRRVSDYAIKAAREAKERTSWLQVDADAAHEVRKDVVQPCGNPADHKADTAVHHREEDHGAHAEKHSRETATLAAERQPRQTTHREQAAEEESHCRIHDAHNLCDRQCFDALQLHMRSCT
jgi:hypothetical protein